MILYISLDLAQSFLVAHRITCGAFNKDTNARLLPNVSDLIGPSWGTKIGIVKLPR